MGKQILMAAALASCAGATAAADVGANTSVGGQAFLDLSHITQQQNGTDVVPTGTGLDVKRAYLIIDHRFDDVWAPWSTAADSRIRRAPRTSTSKVG